MLPEIDIVGQEKLANSSIGIIGLGGLGSPCSIYLAASGIGTMNLFDDDNVELSNLQRQIIFNSSDVGAKKNLIAINEISLFRQSRQTVSIKLASGTTGVAPA